MMVVKPSNPKMEFPDTNPKIKSADTDANPKIPSSNNPTHKP